VNLKVEAEKRKAIAISLIKEELLQLLLHVACREEKHGKDTERRAN
jgi:hypothetical protein